MISKENIIKLHILRFEGVKLRFFEPFQTWQGCRRPNQNLVGRTGAILYEPVEYFKCICAVENNGFDYLSSLKFSLKIGNSMIFLGTLFSYTVVVTVVNERYMDTFLFEGEIDCKPPTDPFYCWE